LSWIFLLEEHDLGQGDEYPIMDSYAWHNRFIKGAGGRGFSKRINSATQTKRRPSFIFNNVTNYGALVTAIANSYGNNLPMILNLDGINVDVVRFVGEFQPNNVGHSDYRPTVIFESVPYIPDGAVL